MPNPSTMHKRSNKINHQLKIVDFFIRAGMPDEFIIEPVFGNYEPDVYMKDKEGNLLCVEIQITPISTKKMQTKLDQFVGSHHLHGAKYFLIVSDTNYTLSVPKGFHVVAIPLPKEPYTN